MRKMPSFSVPEQVFQAITLLRNPNRPKLSKPIPGWLSVTRFLWKALKRILRTIWVSPVGPIPRNWPRPPEKKYLRSREVLLGMLKARSNAPFNGRNEAIGKIEEIAPAHLCEVVIVKGVTEVPVVIGVPACTRILPGLQNAAGPPVGDSEA